MCDYRQMQSDLEQRYQLFHAIANFSPSLAQRLSVPLLVSVFENYIRSRYRIIVIGQEAAGWDFYYNGQDHLHFSDFKRVDVQLAVRATLNTYRGFDFAQAPQHRKLLRSPFWQAYRQLRKNLENDLDQSILWTNIFRMDIGGKSVMNEATDQERHSIYNNTAGLLLDEIFILNPKVAIFFTGPNYDEAIKRQFPNVYFNRFPQHELGTVARLIHPSLPECTIRTYHPGYLRRSRQWDILTDIEAFIRNNVR